MTQSYEEIVDALLEAQNGEVLSIIRLSEPLSGTLKGSSGEGSSDVSAQVFDNPTPAILEADLAHYKVCSVLMVDMFY